MVRSSVVFGVVFFILTALGMDVAMSQEFPNKPIRLVTTPAGGSSDTTSRMIAPGLSSSYGQPVIVDNRGTGFIPGEVVAKAQPDGYTLLVGGSNIWITPLLRKAPYDVANDFSPLSLISREVLIVAVNVSVPAKSIRELIDLAKAKPGALNYGSTSIGGPSHLGAELLKFMAGINIVHIPYKGGASAITALLGGEVQMVNGDIGVLMPHVKSGKIRALAVTSAEPSVLAPGLPTVAASGLPGYEAVSMTAIFSAGKTPVAILNRLNQGIVRVLNMPDIKEKFLNAGIEIVGSSHEQLAAVIKSDVAKMGKVIGGENHGRLMLKL